MDPTKAPELFVSATDVPNFTQTQRILQSHVALHGSPLKTLVTDQGPPLDPRAVACVALKSLQYLGQHQILTQEECSTLVAPFVQNSSDLVRLSVAMHLINRLPESRRGPLQRLLRYLKRLAAFSDVCTAASLGQCVGPTLLRPEKLQGLRGGSEVVSVVGATIQCATMLIQCVFAYL